MARFKQQYASVYLFVTYLTLFKADASRITFKAYPDVLIANLTAAAAMRCELSDTEVTRSLTNTTEDIAHVASILITKNEGQVDVAQGSPYESPSPLVDLGNLEVKGDVSGTSSEGFLELTWKIPSLMDMGDYACEITTIDKHHHTTVFRSTLTMSMVTPSINDIVVMFQTQNQMLKALTEKDAKNTAKNAAEISALHAMLNNQTLENLNQNNDIVSLKQHLAIQTEMLKNQTLEIADLKQTDMLNSQKLTKQSIDVQKLETCVSSRVAFMAVFSSPKSLPGDTRVIFDKIITNTNNGYNATSGQFHCSVPGVYAFSVSDSARAGAIQLNILINSVKITSVAFQTEQFASGFASAVVILKKNDIVFIETESSFTNPHVFYQSTSSGYQSNTFSGQLLHGDHCQL